METINLDLAKRLEEIKKRALNGTPGKITFDSYDTKPRLDRRHNIGLKRSDGREIAVVWNVSNTCIQGHQYNDYELFANAREDILFLLDIINNGHMEVS